MATGSKRDVELNIGVGVTGKETVSDLSARVAGLTAATKEAGKAEADARAESIASNSVLAERREALSRLKIETDAGAKSSTEYAEAERVAKLQILEASTAQRQKREAVAAATIASKAAAEAERALQSELDAATASALRAGVALESAFSTAGVRSAGAIRAELKAIDDALNTIARDTRTSGADFDRAFASAQTRSAALRAELEAVPGAIDKSSKSVSFLSSQFSQLAAAYGGIQLGQAFVDANVQTEALRRSLAFVTGSTEEAAKQIAFLRDTAQKSGITVGSVADSFVRFSASARQAGISSQVVQDTFTGITAAAGKTGISSERVGLILDALGQIAGKGVVSMEELRGQLGDALPGAMKVAANAAGLPLQQFTKLVETGQVLAEDFLPLFATQLKKTFGDGQAQVDGFAQSLARMKNALSDAATFIGQDGGVMSAVARIFESLTLAVKGTVGAIELVGKTVGITFGALATLDLAHPIESFKQYREALKQVTDDIDARFKGTTASTVDAAKQSSSAIASVGQAAVTTGAQVAQGAAGIEQGAQAHEIAAGSALENADAQTKAGSAATVSSAAIVAGAGQQVTGIIALQAAYAQQLSVAEKNIASSEKLAEAKKQESAASVAAAALSGDEARARQVSIVAAEGYLQSLEKVQSAQQREVDLLVAQKAAIIEAAGGEAKLSESKLLLIKNLDLEIQKSQASLEKRVALTEAQRVAFASTQLESELLADNSKRVDQLSAAYQAAKVALDAMSKARSEGKATAEQVAVAEVALAKAERLYIDALQDTVTAIKQKNAITAVDATLSASLINAQRAQIQSQIEVANATNDQRTASELSVRQKYLDIDAINNRVAAMKTEAQSAIAEAAATRAALEASGQLTTAKKVELEIIIKSAQARLNDAAALQAGAEPLRAQIALLQQYATAAGNASSSLDKFNSSVKSVLGSNAYDKSGNALDSSGNLLQIGGQVNVPAGYVFDQAAFNRATQVAIDTHGKYPDPAKYYKPPSGGSEKPGTLTGPVAAPSGLVSNGASGYSPLNANAQAAQAAANAAATVPQSTPSSTSSSHTVEIKLQGTAFEKYQSTIVNLSSQYDAASLVTLLKQLDNSARSAGGVL